MKSILLSIKPEWVEKILNGEKTIEIRKQFPADYVGWVYIYCTKAKPYLVKINDKQYSLSNHIEDYWSAGINGKVVARFWCDKVEEIRHFKWVFDYLLQDKIYKASCLDNKTLSTYLKGHDRFYAIHISQLEIFDRPKALCEFYRKIRPFEQEDKTIMCGQFIGVRVKRLTKAPQNYCYIEGYK